MGDEVKTRVAMWMKAKFDIKVYTVEEFKERVATRSVLLSKNIVLTDQSCPLCSLHQESPNHLFLRCKFSWSVWSQILDWWHFFWVCPSSIAGMASWWFDSSFRNLEKHIWEVCFYATIWSIWIMRNKLIFHSMTISSEEVVDLIKYRVAMWMKVKYEIKVYSIEEFKGFSDGIRLLKL
ncbi:uncharacterized protein LOC131328494 [Rhododendron vialii]|uniref:uncharacterized protein LOC131328494 n=1 Tax=Rhododendron vialii TaxID=182163 RepID=UPI00265ECD0E|nr:uncharacterized protein LOC131328494 [Rhododendron vialii]